MAIAVAACATPARTPVGTLAPSASQSSPPVADPSLPAEVLDASSLAAYDPGATLDLREGRRSPTATAWPFTT